MTHSTESESSVEVNPELREQARNALNTFTETLQYAYYRGGPVFYFPGGKLQSSESILDENLSKVMKYLKTGLTDNTDTYYRNDYTLAALDELISKRKDGELKQRVVGIQGLENIDFVVRMEIRNGNLKVDYAVDRRERDYLNRPLPQTVPEETFTLLNERLLEIL